MVQLVLLWKYREEWGRPCHKMIDFVESSVDDYDDDDDDDGLVIRITSCWTS
jgi:hypothetical protein